MALLRNKEGGLKLLLLLQLGLPSLATASFSSPGGTLQNYQGASLVASSGFGGVVGGSNLSVPAPEDEAEGGYAHPNREFLNGVILSDESHETSGDSSTGGSDLSTVRGGWGDAISKALDRLHPEDSPGDEGADESENTAPTFSGWFESAGAVEVGSADSLLSVLKQFSQLTTSENSGDEYDVPRKKLLLLVAAGQSESQSGGIGHGGLYRLVSSLRGSSSLSEKGKQQARALHYWFSAFLTKASTARTNQSDASSTTTTYVTNVAYESLGRQQTSMFCFDLIAVSPQQNAAETALLAFAGLLENLSCSASPDNINISSLYDKDDSVCSATRLLVAPHLRDKFEAGSESVGGSASPWGPSAWSSAASPGSSTPFSVVLRRMKSLRERLGFRRDVFDCALTAYGERWTKQQLRALGLEAVLENSSSDSPGGGTTESETHQLTGTYGSGRNRHVLLSLEEQLNQAVSAAASPATQHSSSQSSSLAPSACRALLDSSGADIFAAGMLLQELDREAHPSRCLYCCRSVPNIGRVYSFLKSTAELPASSQKAVWEGGPASSGRSGLDARLDALGRSVCIAEGVEKAVLVGHTKPFERLVGEKIKSGHAAAFIIDCQKVLESSPPE